MSKAKHINRRNFLKLAGLTGISLPAVKVVGQIGGDNILYSPEKYGGFLVRQLAAGDAPYEVDDSIYQRFDQKNEVFSRGEWDPIIIDSEAPYASVIPDHIMANDKGFTRLDYAFYTAAWTVATTLGSAAGAVGGSNDGLYSWNPLGGFAARIYGQNLPPWNFGDWSPEDVSHIVKTAAKFYGASLSGITELDERWLYSHRYTKGGTATMGPGISAPIIYDASADVPAELEDGTLIIPKKMKYVIALAFEMDYDGMQTYMSGPGSAATGNGYSRMSFTASCMAEFIRALGYQAIPCGNCTGMSVAFAVDAGLGELGRHGLLMTPKYGPRVRLAKVITDMPLVADSPISFGATEFCEVCGKCADSCPGGGIPTGEKTFHPTYDAVDTSSNPGVKKWHVDTPSCHLVWAVNGMDCSNCIRSCPFNKPQSWLHDATRVLVGAKSGALDKIMLNLDDASD